MSGQTKIGKLFRVEVNGTGKYRDIRLIREFQIGRADERWLHVGEESIPWEHIASLAEAVGHRLELRGEDLHVDSASTDSAQDNVTGNGEGDLFSRCIVPNEPVDPGGSSDLGDGAEGSS